MTFARQVSTNRDASMGLGRSAISDEHGAVKRQGGLAFGLLASATRVAAAEPASELQIATDPDRPAIVGYEQSTPEPELRHHRHGHFPEGVFLPLGASVAAASHPSSPTALALGAEASVVAFPVGPAMWAGGYADLLYEFRNDRTRASFGPELGFTLIGVDGGVVVQSSANGTHWGGVVRPMLTIGLLSVFARFGWLEDDERFVEIGALAKFPIQLHDSSME